MTLTELQAQVRSLNDEKGFGHTSISQRLQLLLEEAGELSRACRPKAGLRISSDPGAVDQEIGDLLFVLVTIAEEMEVDLEQAMAMKLETTRRRTWKQTPP